MSQSLFTSQTPSSGDNSDGAPGITLGTAFRFAVDGQVTGIRFFSTVTISGVYTGEFWETTAADPNGSGGSRLATKTMGAPPSSAGWNTIMFDTPVTIDTAKLYRATEFSGDGRYALTPGFFVSDLVNGDLTSDANGDNPVGLGNLNNGSFTVNAAASYATGGGGSCYFVDVIFEPTGAAETGTVAVTLPALTAAASGTASSTGTVAATLPSLTAAASGTASATATTAATLPALTAAATGTASASGTVAATLPALTVAIVGAIDLGETSSPSRALSTVTRPRTIATTTRERVIATGTNPGGGQ